MKSRISWPPEIEARLVGGETPGRVLAELFNTYGGIKEMAEHLGVKPRTVGYWFLTFGVRWRRLASRPQDDPVGQG